MPHIPYTICRSGCYYYNRRVPKHAVKAYGNFIRVALSRCPRCLSPLEYRLFHLVFQLVMLKEWCPHTDSNRGPTDYKSVALPAEL